MKEVIGVSFTEGKRIYYFDPANIKPNFGDDVIVETERGLQYGKIATLIVEKNEKSLNMPLKRIIRIATKDDRKKHELNLNEEKKAMKECEKLIKKYNLNMKVIDANFTFDKEQLMYHFLSDSRIDFRNLAKELAGIFKTRIELRQIGVRDKAKEIGGIGPCGRTLCCTDYLVNFDSVSINMAKNQNLSLNPNKINGSCGRLLCCLTYENDVYEEYRKSLPNLGDKVKYNEKNGKVVELNILKKSYTILTDDDEYLTIEVK
jgi:cell fate regulator YaaT (PSP1 superfamily)